MGKVNAGFAAFLAKKKASAVKVAPTKGKAVPAGSKVKHVKGVKCPMCGKVC